MKKKGKILLVFLVSVLLFGCELDLSYHYFDNPDWIQGKWMNSEDDYCYEFTENNLCFYQVDKEKFEQAFDSNDDFASDSYDDLAQDWADNLFEMKFKRGPGVYILIVEEIKGSLSRDVSSRGKKPNYSMHLTFNMIDENNIQFKVTYYDCNGNITEENDPLTYTRVSSQLISLIKLLWA